MAPHINRGYSAFLDLVLVRPLKKVLHFSNASASIEYKHTHINKQCVRNKKGAHLAVMQLHCFKRYKDHY